MARPRGWKISRKTLELLLVQSGMTRSDLSAKSGVSQQQISDMTSFKRAGASVRTAAAIADALGCDVEVVFPEAEGYGPPSDQADRRPARRAEAVVA